LENFFNILPANGVGLAYFLGSQKELGPARLRGETVEGKPDSDLDLGVVCLASFGLLGGAKAVATSARRPRTPFTPLRLHLPLLEEENAHIQYAAIPALRVYAVNEDFTLQYRQDLTL
jgi:hypothetical protein